MTVKKLLPALIGSVLASAAAHAGVELIAIGTVDGAYQDLSNETAAPLENGIAGNRLGGIGSGFAFAGGTTFLALPDRGPNANAYNPAVDDTVSYIARFQTFDLRLAPTDPGSELPFVLTPTLRATTLLSSRTPLVYGSGAGLGYQHDNVTPLGSGAPSLNALDHRFYFTGRSDNFDPARPSTYTNDARLDPEGIRVSNDGRRVFVSDEYGPYVYEFDRATGTRLRAFRLPDNLAIESLSAQKSVEIAGNSAGRTTNKGMEGLAITPDGKMLVGIMQANLLQDKKKSLRIVTIDIRSGETHEYAYQLTEGSGASEILAVNDHEFLVDERGGNGFADTPLLSDTASAAEVKKLFRVDLDGAQDVTSLVGDLSAYAVAKTEFLDVVKALTAPPGSLDPKYIPSKIEGVAFGQDVVVDGKAKHTLFITNDNDFLPSVADPSKDPGDPTRGLVPNPNEFFVFTFEDSDLPGYVPQPIRSAPDGDGDRGDEHRRDDGRRKGL